MLDCLMSRKGISNKINENRNRVTGQTVTKHSSVLLFVDKNSSFTLNWNHPHNK